jgi:hypothetical protein
MNTSFAQADLTRKHNLFPYSFPCIPSGEGEVKRNWPKANPSPRYASGWQKVPWSAQVCGVVGRRNNNNFQGKTGEKREWRGAESNRRRRDFQSLALPTELPRHCVEELRFQAAISIFSHRSKVNKSKTASRISISGCCLHTGRTLTRRAAHVTFIPE